MVKTCDIGTLKKVNRCNVINYEGGRRVVKSGQRMYLLGNIIYVET